MARVVELNISESREAGRQSVGEATFVSSSGVAGDDLHHGSRHGVSLLAKESLDRIDAMGIEGLCTRRFYANIVTQGAELFCLSVGTRLIIGDVRLAITQIGKPCWKDDGCAIYDSSFDCILKNEAVFADIEEGGVIHVGDDVTAGQP